MRLTIFWAVPDCQAWTCDRAVYGWAFHTGTRWTVVACAIIKPNAEVLDRLGAARLYWSSICQQTSLKEALPSSLGTFVSSTRAEPIAGPSATDTSAAAHDLQLSIAIDSRSCRGATFSYKVACSLQGQPVRPASCRLVHLAAALSSPVHYWLPGRLANHQPATPLTKALALCNCCGWLSFQLQSRGGVPQHQPGPLLPLHAPRAARGLTALIRSSFAALQGPGMSMYNAGPVNLVAFQLLRGGHTGLDTKPQAAIWNCPVGALQVLMRRLCGPQTWISGWPMQLSSVPTLRTWRA